MSTEATVYHTRLLEFLQYLQRRLQHTFTLILSTAVAL